MYSVIGRCSLCDGDVLGFTGPWFGTTPPRSYCSKCGAVEARNSSVIPMERPGKIFEKGIGSEIFETIGDGYTLTKEFSTIQSTMDKAFEALSKSVETIFSKKEKKVSKEE
jgi:hypothetical protein